MKKISLISGSTLGNAEYVAEHLADILNKNGFETEVLHGPNLSELDVNNTWLVVSSTHGAGELPENIQPLFESIKGCDLTNLSFAAVGLGSSEYDTYCAAIKRFVARLIDCGANQITSVLEIDVTCHEIPEDPAEIWLTESIELFK